MVDWITNLIETLGYVGIFGLMVLEHLFPPIPSEVIIPLAGFSSSQSSDIQLGWVIAVGSLGSLLGTLAWYILGRMVSRKRMISWIERYGQWLTLTPADLDRAIAFFHQRGGGWVVGLGRVVPGVRTYVSIPAGLNHMPLLPYIFYSALGTVVWTSILAIAGYTLGDQFDQVQRFISPVSKIVLVVVGIALVSWIILRRRQTQSGE